MWRTMMIYSPRNSSSLIKKPFTQFTQRRYNSNFRILLIRHGQSIANKDPTLFTTMADFAIPLSDLGVQQSQDAGNAVKEFFERAYPDGRPNNRHCRLWTSPYKRARETGKIIHEKAGHWITDVRENVLLGEQQFGLFEGVDWSELEKFYPNEVEYYRKASRFGGRFWARMPLGESRFDVCQRVHQAFGNFHRDLEKHDIRDIIIVSHGVTLRAFVMMWMDHSPEWFETEPNFRNCSIRLIDRGIDRGYIHLGPEVENTSDPQDVLLRRTKKQPGKPE